MSRNNLTAAAVIVALGGLGYAAAGNYSTPPLVLSVLAAGAGAIIFTGFDKKLFELHTAASAGSSAFEAKQEPFEDFDQVWEELQDWYQSDPRDNEIIWKDGVSMFDTTVPESIDGEYRFLALVTPNDNTDQNVFGCVEMETKSLIKWDERGEVNRKDPFEDVSLVADLRERKNVSASEAHQQIMNSRVAQLGGNPYNSFMNGGGAPKPRPDESAKDGEG